MRRLTALACALACSLAACAAGSSAGTTPTPGSPQVPAPATLYPTATSSAPATAAATVAQTTAPTLTPEKTAAPSGAGATTVAPRTPPPAPTEVPTPLPKISLAPHGINVANYDNGNIEALLPFGFGWIQVFNPPDYPIANYKVLHRVPLGNAVSGKPEDIDAWADQLESLVRERRGLIHAYSIGNEVNLSREWGGQTPDPYAYAKLLAIGYARVKTADPDALVVSAGIAPTGGDAQGAMDDLKYARALFEAGAADYLDAYGFHPYGFAYEPEHDPNDPAAKGLLFRRAEAHRALMEEFGAGEKPMWATEFGWLIDPREEGAPCSWPDLDWQRVSRARQAEYVVRAYDYAQKNWPWMGPMFLWNYDFSRSPLYPDPCEQMKFFSMLDEAGQRRPLFDTLAASARQE